MADMMIPFIMLLMVTIALVLERKFQEEKIHEIYEDKFKNWKEHSTKGEQKQCKELVGLVYLEDYTLEIELLDDKALDQLTRKKYTIKSKG